MISGIIAHPVSIGLFDDLIANEGKDWPSKLINWNGSRNSKLFGGVGGLRGFAGMWMRGQCQGASKIHTLGHPHNQNEPTERNRYGLLENDTTDLPLS